MSAAHAIDSFEIPANKIDRFQGKQIGKPVGKGLIWRGGLHLLREIKNFGGLSDLTFTSNEGHMAIVTDKGHFISAQLLYDEKGAPKAIAGAKIERLRNSKGVKLPTVFSRDPEAVDTVYRDGKPVAVRVGFEHLTRVADFTIDAEIVPAVRRANTQSRTGSPANATMAPLKLCVLHHQPLQLQDQRSSSRKMCVTTKTTIKRGFPASGMAAI